MKPFSVVAITKHLSPFTRLIWPRKCSWRPEVVSASTTRPLMLIRR